MKIEVKLGTKIYYIQGKEKRKQPSITPFKERAHKFKDLSSCKNIRDDVLEYFERVTIVS